MFYESAILYLLQSGSLLWYFVKYLHSLIHLLVYEAIVVAFMSLEAIETMIIIPFMTHHWIK